MVQIFFSGPFRLLFAMLVSKTFFLVFDFSFNFIHGYSFWYRKCCEAQLGLCVELYDYRFWSMDINPGIYVF